jgi:hypothetical protein
MEITKESVQAVVYICSNAGMGDIASIRTHQRLGPIGSLLELNEKVLLGVATSCDEKEMDEALASAYLVLCDFISRDISPFEVYHLLSDPRYIGSLPLLLEDDLNLDMVAAAALGDLCGDTLGYHIGLINAEQYVETRLLSVLSILGVLDIFCRSNSKDGKRCIADLAASYLSEKLGGLCVPK